MATKSSVKSPNPVKVKWDALRPAHKKTVMAGGALLAVIMVSLAVVSTDTSGGGAKKTAQQQMDNVLLPEEGVRDIGVSGMSTSLRDAMGELRTIKGDVARLKQQLERAQETGGAGSSEKRMVDEIGQLREEQSRLATLVEQLKVTGEANETAAATAAANEPTSLQRSFGGIRSVDQQASEAAAHAAVSSDGAQTSSSAAPAAGAQEPGPQDRSTPQAPPAPRRSVDEMFYLPAGSILQGVLLSGVDAPSGKSAMKDPVPVLARIKHNAILPNRYKANIKECFVLLETVGDLASERAMMRAVTISCVRSDRTVMEVSLAGYAVGEDGKAGMRGKVVTKQGSVLGMAMISGFADGLSRAFGGSDGGLGTISTEALQEGGIAGSSTALQKVSEWYLERADELTPTINIDSGRKITIVVTKGRDLAPLAASSKAGVRTERLPMQAR